MKNFTILLSFLFIISSCTDPVQGLFYSIEKEVKTGDSSNALPNTVTVLGTAVLSAGTPQEQIFVAANSLYRGTTGGVWERLSPEIPGFALPVIYDVGTIGSTLYVVAGQNSSRGLFKSTDGRVFTAVNTGATAGTPEKLMEIQGDSLRLLVTWNTNTTGFQVYSLDNTAFNTQALLPTPASTDILQALYTGTDYFAVNGSLAYTGASLTSVWTAEAVTLGGVSAGNLGGIIHTSVLNSLGTKEIVASTSRGMLVRRITTPAVGWENYPGLAALTTTTGTQELTTLTEWTTGSTPAQILLVGALGSGYAEAWYDAKTSAAVFSKTNLTVESVAFVNSALGKKTVTGFQKFNSSLYAETPAGLWKYSGSTWNWE